MRIFSTLNAIKLNTKIVMMLFVTIFFIACADERDDLIEHFNVTNEQVHKGEFDVLVNNLDSMSMAYLDEITNPENHNLEAIKQIGHKYKLRISSLVYFYRMGNYTKKGNREIDFFRHLALNEYPWFDIFRVFELHEKKIRMGDIRNYVPIVTRRYDTNYLYWVAFRKNGKNQYDYDLMYSLILMEDKLKRRYEPAIKAMVPGITKDEMLDGLWAQWELDPFKPHDFSIYNFDRTSHDPDIIGDVLKK